MDTLVHEVAERCIDHPLPLDAVLTRERPTLDAQGEMALAEGVVAGVSKMPFAVVYEFNPGGRKRRIEPAKHFSRDRAGSLCVHRRYIKGFDGN